MFQLQKLTSFIDHTLLKPQSTEQEIIRICNEAIQYRFKSVCVNPDRVRLAARILTDTDVSVGTVTGFPLGAGTTAIKVAEASTSVQEGANEIDLVINLGLLKDGHHQRVFDEVKAVVEAVLSLNPKVIVKTIIETCYLTNEEKKTASLLCEKAGAHIIKTSTGMGSAGATLEDIRIIRKTVSPQTGVKASGGVKSLKQAIQFIEAGATRIGTSSSVRIMEELAGL